MMLRFFLFVILLWVVIADSLEAQPLRVAFYNVENLFDTVKDPGVFDEEYTPDGRRKWTQEKYERKISCIARVIWDMAPDVMGLAEVENLGVLEDLTGLLARQGVAYDILHFPSTDPRGIGVALLYKPARVSIRRASSVLPAEGRRSFLLAEMTAGGCDLNAVVCHLSSNLSRNRYREQQINRLRKLADSLAGVDPEIPLVLMGDFNENPDGKAISRLIRNEGLSDTSRRLYNPFMPLFRQGEGTTAYRDRWSMFDYMLVNDALLNRRRETPNWFLVEGSARIFRPGYLLEQGGRYKGYPKRTFWGMRYNGGYSDHLPVLIELDQ